MPVWRHLEQQAAHLDSTVSELQHLAADPYVQQVDGALAELRKAIHHTQMVLEFVTDDAALARMDHDPNPYAGRPQPWQ